MLKPLAGYVLVEIIDTQYENIKIIKKSYESTQTGKVIEQAQTENEVDLTGKFVYWKEYADKDATFSHDGKTVAFIKYEDIRGYEA